jgi:trimeric autotransporter adhesin
VSRRVYISGGVAGSTVKGSTGGRVGVAFGF